jgi:hypothetical protein
MAETQPTRADLERRRTSMIPFLPRANAAETCGNLEIANHFLTQAIDGRGPLSTISLAGRRALSAGDSRYEPFPVEMNFDAIPRHSLPTEHLPTGTPQIRFFEYNWRLYFVGGQGKSDDSGSFRPLRNEPTLTRTAPSEVTDDHPAYWFAADPPDG